MSLEKEVFPFMAQDGHLFAFDLEGTYTYMHCTYIHTVCETQQGNKAREKQYHPGQLLFPEKGKKSCLGGI